MKGLSRVAGLIAVVPLLLLRRLVRSDASLWLFGAWFGERYADNSRHLYEYVLRECPDVRAVWISGRRSVRDAVREAGGTAVSPWSLRGVWWSLVAGCGVVSNSERDLNPYLQPRRMINLWHGFPLKKIRLDNPFERRRDALKAALNWVLPHSRWRMDLGVVALGAEHAELMTSAFSLDPELAITTGYPRNDRLIGGSAGVDRIRTVAYLPTFRDRSGFSPMSHLSDAALAGLDDGLLELGLELVVRHHPVDHGSLPAGLRATRVDDSDRELHEWLADVDVLITDYSSVYVDFLLTGRPIVFAPFDLHDYTVEDRPMYYRYEDVTPGPKCNSWDEVLQALRHLKEDPSWFAADREQLRDRWHLHHDASSSERVVRYLRGQLA